MDTIGGRGGICLTSNARWFDTREWSGFEARLCDQNFAIRKVVAGAGFV